MEDLFRKSNESCHGSTQKDYLKIIFLVLKKSLNLMFSQQREPCFYHDNASTCEFMIIIKIQSRRNALV